MIDIPRWPKISLLDDPDEEERARQQLNESRRQRGLPPLYPESGFPPSPPVFGGIVLTDPREIDPEFYKKPGDFNFAEGEPGAPGTGDQVAQAEPSGSSADMKEPPSRTNPGSRPSSQADTADASPPRKPLTYEQVKRLVRENNHSKMPDELIIAIIFKESSFDPSARNKNLKSTETGLMQINQEAWKALHTRGLKSPEPDFKHALDPATNIQRSSAYLQMRIEELGGSLERGLASYGTGKQYATDIIAATKALQQNPDNPVAALSKAYRRKYP